MNKKELLFYDDYEAFYTMTKESNAFRFFVKMLLVRTFQEGDVILKTSNAHTTMLVKALQENNMTYEVTDITKQTYELLKKKRESAIKYRTLFEDEGYSQWFDMPIGQTEYINVPFE